MKIGIIAAEGTLEMKGLLISFVIGLLVGVAYGLIRVKSPAPPIVALIGLLGMVLGEQAGVRLLPKKARDTNVSSAHVLSEGKDRQECPNAKSIISAVNRGVFHESCLLFIAARDLSQRSFCIARSNSREWIRSEGTSRSAAGAS